MSSGGVAPEAFLASLPASLVVPIARGCARMAVTRREALERYAAGRKG